MRLHAGDPDILGVRACDDVDVGDPRVQASLGGRGGDVGRRSSSDRHDGTLAPSPGRTVKGCGHEGVVRPEK